MDCESMSDDNKYETEGRDPAESMAIRTREPETLLMDCESVSDDNKYETEGRDPAESMAIRTRQEQCEEKESEELIKSLYGLPVNLPFCIRHYSQTSNKVLDSKVYIIAERVDIADLKLKQIQPIRINVSRGMQDVSLLVSNCKRFQYKDSLVREGGIGEKKTFNNELDETEDMVEINESINTDNVLDETEDMVEINESINTDNVFDETEDMVEINESINTDNEQVTGKMKDDRDVNIKIVSGILNDVLNSIGKQLRADSEYSGEQRNNSMENGTSSKPKCESNLNNPSYKKLPKIENDLNGNLPRSARIRSKGYRINYAQLGDTPSGSDDDSDTTNDSGKHPSCKLNEKAGPSGLLHKKDRKKDPDFIPEIDSLERSDDNVERRSSSDFYPSDSEEDDEKIKRKEIAAKKKLKKLSLQKKRIKVTLNEHSDKFYTEDQVSVERKHRGKTELEKTFKLLVCSECNKFRTESKSQMEMHIEFHINGDLSCKQCEYKAHSLNDLLKHRGYYHISKKKCFCLICDDEFSSKAMYRDHISSVHNLLPYLCSICSTKESPVSFKDIFFVRKHYLENHKDKMFQCDLCGLCYLSKEGLKNHICAAKNFDEKIPCEICGIRINSNSLNSHKKKVHFNVRSHPCSQCQYAAKNSKQLKAHIQAKHEHIHTIKCDECDFTCVRAFQLVSHKRTHTGDKPYKCDQCPYAAAWNVQLKDHKKLHGGAMGKECEACGIVMRIGSAYTKHMKKEHGGTDET